jgi:2-haloacid dehalogenase
MTDKKKMPIIVFDFGAVLVDWSPYYLYRKVMKNDDEIKAFLEEIDFKQWNPQFDKGYPFEKGVDEKCAEFPHRADLIRRFDSHWLDCMGEVMTGTAEVAHQLKASGYTLYGLSNWSVSKFNLVKDRFVFLDDLDGYLLSGEVQQIKPDAEIFHSLLERIGCSAPECLFIDDSAANIQAAKDLGFQTIQFRSAEQLVKELNAMGVKFQ